MTAQEIQRIQQEIANKTPGELMEEARKRQDLINKVNKLKKIRKWK